MSGESAAGQPWSRLFSWPSLVAVLLLTQAILSLTLKQGPTLIAYCEISYLLLLLLGSGIATLNAVQSRQKIRLFWSFLAISLGLWALVPCAWLYSVLLHGKIPAFIFDTPPLFVHIVLMIAAVASRPHLRLPTRRPYRTTLNFLILLFVWVFAYAYLLFPYEYAPQPTATILGFEALYFTENLLLLVAVGILIGRSQAPWKSVYKHLFGASALYAFGSLAANVVWALKDPGGDLTGASFPVARGLIGTVFTASISWFVWVGLRGRKLAPQLAQTVQLDTADTKYSSALAMLAVLAIPIVGVWELFRTDEPFATHEIRLFLVLISGVLLAVAAFVQDYLANREFSSDVGMAHDRLRLAMESGKSVAWEWDTSNGENLRFGDLRTMFGIKSDTHIGNIDEFLRSVHPEERQLVEKAIAEAKQNRYMRAIEFRIVWPDGTVRWVAARGKYYHATSADPERVFGMMVDITDQKHAEEAIRESEERFRLVANTAPVLIWMSGADKMCTYFNKPWLDFTGRSFASQLGYGWAEGIHIEDLQKSLGTFDRAFDRRRSFQMEYRLRRHDGAFRWVVDIGVPRFNADGSFAGFIGSAIDVTERKLAEEALSGVSRKLIDAQEKERTRIARELHDDINQRLALLAIELEQLTRHPSKSVAEISERIHELCSHVSEIGSEVQAMSHRLHSSKLEYLGIVSAAKSFCRELSEQQKVEIDFTHKDVPRNVAADASLCLFRVLQEALHNAIKHSGVRHFEVQLAGTPSEIELAVCDLGAGFDTDAALNNPGLGLISMRERVTLVSGSISIKSKPMGGTRISVRVPIAEAGASPVTLPSDPFREPYGRAANRAS